MDHTGHLSDKARAELHKLDPDKQVRILAVADHETRNPTAPGREDGAKEESGLHRSTRLMFGGPER